VNIRVPSSLLSRALLGLVLALPAGAAPDPEARDYLELPGNVPRALAGSPPLGPVPAAQPMARMILALRMAPEAQARLQRRLAALQDPGSADYHRWLTPEQFGAEFGPSGADLDRVTAWLQAGGFQVEEVAAGRMSVLFSGTVAQVEQAFRTAILRYRIDGQARQGNAGNPRIPRALAGLVEGVVSLHNLPRRALNSGIRSLADAGQVTHPLAPGDFAAIYNVDPLYRDGIDGSGTAIAIVGRTHIPLSDIAGFRARFGLPAREPEVILNGPDPGDLGAEEDGEADLDLEWSGAVARNAAIRFVLSGSTASTDGVDLSARFIVDRNLAPVLSVSFGQCEANMGAAETAFFRDLWSQAAAQGITVCVSSGDSGPAGCDGGASSTGSGPAVSGLASTPFDVAVGGTQFDEGSGAYWRERNDPDGGSALGYIPEKAWNESGAAPGGSGLWAGGGGPSGLHALPSWQRVLGVPAGARFRCTPDVALASAGNHDGYQIQTSGWPAVVGGTSCAAPAFAGLMALVVQATGQRQGNANTVLYPLANAQFKGTGPALFHDTTAGDTTVPGTKGYPCTPGYDLATGLGSVDAQALVGAWTRGAGTDVEATILEPAGSLTIPDGTRVAFQGAARESNPDAAMTYAWDFGDGQKATGIRTSHVFRNPGQNDATYTVTFTATDGSGAHGSDSRGITVTALPVPGERIVNGGFEHGTKGWTARAVFLATGGSVQHSGKASAMFQGWGAHVTGLLEQTVRIPAKAASARLSFWLDTETFGYASKDLFQVKVRGADGILRILGTWPSQGAVAGYQQHTLDLGAYRGQKISLAFVASYSAADSFDSNFALDDVSLIAP
jgi:hypothetical protein